MMPVNFTTLAHFSVSSAMSLPKSAGETTSGVPPKSASRAFSSCDVACHVTLRLGVISCRHKPLEVRKGALCEALPGKAGAGIQFNEHCDDLPADVVFQHACKLGFEGIVSKRLGSPYRSGRSRDWRKMKNPNAPAVKREAEEDWGKERWR